MSKSSKSDTIPKVILILGVIILAVGIATLIRLVFFKPLPVEAPSEDMQMEMRDDMSEQPLDDNTQQQEEQLEQSTVQD